MQEAIAFLHEGKFRSPRAAAREYSGRLPGGIDANFDRIYKKILARKDEPDAESEEDDSVEDGLIRLAIELVGEAPEVKVQRLTRLFRIIIENARVVDDVIGNLRQEGIVLPDDLLKQLMKIHLYIVLNEKEMPEYDDKVKKRKKRTLKGLGQRATKRTEE